MRPHRIPARTTLALVALCAGLTLTASVRPASAQFVACRANEQDPKDLMVITDQNTLQPWSLRKFPGHIVRSEPSPTGQYIAALTVDPTTKKDGMWTFVLQVIDRNGQTVVTAQSAHDFKFSPDGRFIAVTRGRRSKARRASFPRPRRSSTYRPRTGGRFRSSKTRPRSNGPRCPRTDSVSWGTGPPAARRCGSTKWRHGDADRPIIAGSVSLRTGSTTI